MEHVNLISIFDLFDQADSEGVVTLPITTDPSETLLKSKELIRDWLELTLYAFPILTIRLGKVKKSIDEIDMELTVTEQKQALLSFNLAKLALLPGENPRQELAELRAFFELAKAAYLRHGAKRYVVKITNNWTQNGKVYGEVRCSGAESATSDVYQADSASAQELNQFIAERPVLTTWMTNVARALRRLGPWPWCAITEEQLFGQWEGPFSKSILDSKLQSA